MPRRGDGIERRNGKFVARPIVNGRRLKARTFDSYTEAKRYKHDTEEAARGPEVVTETCDEFAGRWLDDFPLVGQGKRAGRPKLPETLKGQRSNLRAFSREFEGIPLPVLLDPIGRKKLRRFVLDQPNAARTVKTMLASAKDDGLLSAHPMDGIPIPKSDGRKHNRVISEDQLHHLANAALLPAAKMKGYGPEFRASILFSAYVGPRLSSLRWLERDELDFEDAEVFFRVAKGETPYPAILLPEAIEAVRSFDWPFDRKPVREEEGSSPLVFASPRHRSLNGTTHFALWERVRSAANMPDFDWHELRHWCGHHFYVTLGYTDELTGAQLGHEGGEQVRRTYGHGQQDAIQRLKSGMRARQGVSRIPTKLPRAAGESA